MPSDLYGRAEVWIHQSVDKYGNASIKIRIEVPMLLMDDLHPPNNKFIVPREEPSMGRCGLTEFAKDHLAGPEPIIERTCKMELKHLRLT